jgi:hypothetical protein
VSQDSSQLWCRSCSESFTGKNFCPRCGSRLEPMPGAAPAAPAPAPRRRSRRRALVIALIVVVVGLLVVFTLLGGEGDLSPAQEEILETLGYPAQFVIAYLPAGEGDEVRLVRTETWYYPEHEKKVIFTGGELVTALDFVPEAASLPDTDLRPEDFEFHMDYDQVAELVGGEVIEADLLPELIGDANVKTYLGDRAIFCIEEDQYLTYLKTLALEEE